MLAKGGLGGVVPARLVTRSSHAPSLSVLSHPSREARRIVFDFQGSRITPPAPPLQGGERDRSLATSFHRAQQEHASRNRPSSSVNTNFSLDHFRSPHRLAATCQPTTTANGSQSGGIALLRQSRSALRRSSLGHGHGQAIGARMHGSAPWKTEETIVGLPRLLVLSVFSRSDSPDLVADTFHLRRSLLDGLRT